MRAITYEIRPWRYLPLKLLARFRRRTLWGRLSALQYHTDWPEPPLPGDDWVRIRPTLGGICGSDVGAVTLDSPPDSFLRAFITGRFVMGHESIGRITELGSQVSDFKIGDRVNVEPVLSCLVRGLEPVCPSCREGLTASCHNMIGGRLPPGLFIGLCSGTSGWWSESLVAHRSQLYRVPDAITDEQAVLVDPLACSLHAVLRRPPADHETVLVFGAGIIGLGIVSAIRALGSRARITVLARYEFQKRLCLQRGADLVILPADLGDAGLYPFLGQLFKAQIFRGSFGKPILLGGADLVYDSIGSRNTTEDSLRVVRAGGAVVLVGMGHARWVDWDPVTHKQLTLIGAYGRAFEPSDPRRRHTYELVHEAILAGRLPTEGLLTHTFALHDYSAAFEAVTGRGRSGCVKAAFRI